MSLPIKLDLPDGFLCKENRSGYEVCEKQKKIWAVELDLLDRLNRVCMKYGIKYQIAYGTLIGAVRHKGFIPWDDDLDVWMLRDDYKKLCDVPKEEFGENCFLQTDMSDQRFVTLNPRLRNSLTTGMIRGQEDRCYNNGIYIDIYILDGYPRTRLGYVVQYLMLYVSQRLLSLNRRLFGSARPSIVYEILVRLNAWARTLYNNDAKEFFTINVFGYYGTCGFGKMGWGISREEMSDSIQLEFENMKFPAPRCYDRVLKALYGNYMKFPPLDQRGKWHEGIISFEPEISYLECIGRNGQKGKN